MPLAESKAVQERINYLFLITSTSTQIVMMDCKVLNIPLEYVPVAILV